MIVYRRSRSFKFFAEDGFFSGDIDLDLHDEHDHKVSSFLARMVDMTCGMSLMFFCGMWHELMSCGMHELMSLMFCMWQLHG